MSYADKMEYKEPHTLSEYANSIYVNLRQQEQDYKLQPDYLIQIQSAAEVKETSRAFLIEWIIDVHRKFRLRPETLYSAVYLIDHYLSKKQIKKS